MNYETRGPTGPQSRNKRNIPLLIAALGGLAIVGTLFYYGVSAVAGGFSQPTPEEVVQRFRSEGLEVGESYPVEDEPLFQESPAPEVEESGVRFVIPSACANDECGGRVFSFETEEDLETMAGYYEGLNNTGILGGNLGGYTYRDGLLLLQIGSDTKKNKADKYGEVFEDM